MEKEGKQLVDNWPKIMTTQPFTGFVCYDEGLVSSL